MFEKPQDDVDLPVPIVSEPNYDALDHFAPLKTEDYESFKKDFLVWLATKGKRPFRGDGYADTTLRTTHYKVEIAYRWLWEREETYTKEFTPEDATELLEFLVRRTTHPESYVSTFEKSLKRLFKFRREKQNQQIPEWDHDIPLDTNTDSSSKDKFYPEEMRALYEAALAISSARVGSS